MLYYPHTILLGIVLVFLGAAQDINIVWRPGLSQPSVRAPSCGVVLLQGFRKIRGKTGCWLCGIDILKCFFFALFDVDGKEAYQSHTRFLTFSC